MWRHSLTTLEASLTILFIIKATDDTTGKSLPISVKYQRLVVSKTASWRNDLEPISWIHKKQLPSRWEGGSRHTRCICRRWGRHTSRKPSALKSWISCTGLRRKAEIYHEMLELQNGVRIPELVYPKLLKIRAKNQCWFRKSCEWLISLNNC